MNDPIFRVIDGVEIEVTPEEAAVIKAEWQDAGAAMGRVPTLSREAFCVALFNAGILTETEASDAALGAWPPKFEPALAGRDLITKLTIKNLWRETRTVAQNAPLFLDLLAFYAGMNGLNAGQTSALSASIFAAAKDG